MKEASGQERIILWPRGNIPFFGENGCVPAPDAYPVSGAAPTHAGALCEQLQQKKREGRSA